MGGSAARADAGGVHPPRPDERQWARTFGPDRIEQNVAAARLNQERRMADVGYAHARAGKARRRAIGLERAGVGLGPGHAPIGQLPSQDGQLALWFKPRPD
jgi:hypothetical protein